MTGSGRVAFDPDTVRVWVTNNGAVLCANDRFR